MLKTSFSLVLAAALLPAAASALDRADDQAPSARISYADLNLASAAGQAVLQARVHRAAETMCLDNRVSDLVRRALARSCYKAAIASASPQVERAFAAAGSGRRLASAEVILAFPSRR